MNIAGLARNNVRAITVLLCSGVVVTVTAHDGKRLSGVNSVDPDASQDPATSRRIALRPRKAGDV